MSDQRKFKGVRFVKIQFIGTAHEVTGSCTLLKVCGKYYLLDCGMEQGLDVFQNISLPVPPTYDTNDAAGTSNQLRRCRYGEQLWVAEGIEVHFSDIGHLLSSACIELFLTEGDVQVN